MCVCVCVCVCVCMCTRTHTHLYLHLLETIRLDQWFSTREIFPPRDIWQCLQTILTVRAGVGGWVLLPSTKQKPQLLLNILQSTGQPLTTKNYLTQNVSSAEVEKPCFTLLSRMLIQQQCWLLHFL